MRWAGYSSNFDFLDHDIADYHQPLADRYKLKFEISYRVCQLGWKRENQIDHKYLKQVWATLAEKMLSDCRDKTSLPEYYFGLAMLQEVTKIVSRFAERLPSLIQAEKSVHFR